MQLQQCEIKGSIDWMNCSVCQPHLNSIREPVSEGTTIDDEMCLSGSMSPKIELNFVYQRKRQRINSVPPVILQTDEATLRSNSAIRAEGLSLSGPCSADYGSDYPSDAARDRSVNSMECDRTGSSKTVFQQQDLASSTKPEGRIYDDDLCLLNHSRNASHLSASCALPQNITFDFVYKRRRRRRKILISPVNQPTTDTPTGVDNFAISSECNPLLAGHQCAACAAERPIGAKRSMPLITSECIGVDKFCINGLVSRDEAISEDSSKSEADGVANCSSSRSNMEHSFPLNDGVDDVDDCSSGALVVGEAQGMSEKDICISILRSRGLLDNMNQHTSTGNSSGSYCMKSCRMCNCKDSTKNMLICDDCGDAFHKSCCIPCIKGIPVGEWLCSSCMKRKKILTGRLKSSSVDKSSGNGRHSQSECDAELGSLGYTLRDTEPYMSNVRIGDKYQADVPHWHGPNDEESDLHGHPLELDPCGSSINQEPSSLQPVKLGSIGNWIQCRGVLDGIGEDSDGVVCGKWRRAPVFEVQTDAWECFCCVSWDPARADCAAPQEVETEEVLKQLKYMDLLRPRFMEKRRKLDPSKRAAAKQAPPL